MPSVQIVSIGADDDSVDFGQFKKPVQASHAANGLKKTTPATRTLILAPPSVAAHEEKLLALFAPPSPYDRAACDLQMLDRLAAGLVPLAANAYDCVLVLTDADGAQRAEALALLTSRKVYAALVPAMKNGAQLMLQDGRPLEGADAREAILAGLVQNSKAGGAFEKVEEEEVVVPLRLRKKAPAKPSTAPVVLSAKPVAKRPAVMLDLGEYSDGDELVDEDTLMTAAERSRPPQQPPCNVDGQKRRKPCKDCTCGLSERLEEEDRDRRARADVDLASKATADVFKFGADDLNELDFTVQGKTGSCNSCSLGDAFRCSTCPYIGLPAFKPGEEVKILSGLVQL